MAAPPPSDLDAEIRALYQGPPAEFVAARQALVRRLRGDPRQAEVKALAKPPVSAWAVNRLFAVEAEAMAELVETGERARTAAAGPGTSGGGDAAELAERVAAIRSGVERLTGRGIEVLAAEAGRAPGEAIVERLRTNLQALAFDPATAGIAARGWLDRDLDPPGFELLAALTVASSSARPRPRPASAPPAAPPEEAAPPATVHDFDQARRAAAERAEREARARRERIERACEELAHAEAAAAEARAAAGRAGEEAERAEREAAEAERIAAAARETARTARRTATEAERRAADGAAEARRAREELSRAERAGGAGRP